MTVFQFANRASAHLAAPVTLIGTELTLAPGTGDRFPAATPEAPMQVTLVSTGGSSEIVRCHGRSGDVLKDLWRGQEGTSVNAFDTGSLVELRLTAEVLNSFLPLGGGTMQGDLDMAGHTIGAANLSGGPFIDYVKTNATFPPDGNYVGAIEMINGGVQPRINTYSVLTTGLLWGAVFLWWGAAADIPPWLKICDGSLNTPDLRSRFPLGADHDGNMFQYGGVFRSQTFPGGGHNHDGVTQLTQLGAFNLPGLAGTAPSINQTKQRILQMALAASSRDAGQDFVINVTGTAGSVSYSGAPTHAHGLNGVADHAHLIDLVPPYVRMHYVMFRSMQIN